MRLFQLTFELLVEAQQLSVPNAAVKGAVDMHIEALRQRWFLIN